MDALIGWRTSTLQSPPGNIPSRGPSPTPLSDEEPLSDSDEREPLHRAGSDPLDVTRKPTSSSWSRWWSRSRNNKDTEGSKKTTRPNIRETASDAVSKFGFSAFVSFLTSAPRLSCKGANQRSSQSNSHPHRQFLSHLRPLLRLLPFLHHLLGLNPPTVTSLRRLLKARDSPKLCG